MNIRNVSSNYIALCLYLVLLPGTQRNS